MPATDTLRLSGDCGLKTIRARRDEVSAALEAATSLEIDCTDAEGVDVSFVQLMASAARTAEHTGKQLRITNMPAAGRAAFARAGLSMPGL